MHEGLESSFGFEVTVVRSSAASPFHKKHNSALQQVLRGLDDWLTASGSHV